ncbi:MAG: SDR family oxidoreductase [Opitutales bacterium]|nr:SDR family oxidoreductase [Opitutales bacterium]
MCDTEQSYFIGGISGGLGRALAKSLIADGHKVAGFSKSGVAVDGADVFKADATDPKAVAEVFAAARETLGPIDGYAHAIGTVFLKPAHTIRDEEWQNVLETNLFSAFYALRAAVEGMRRSKSGSIVLVSSVAARFGLPSHEAIAAAKGGVEGLVRSAAASYVNFGIRVNAVAPGLVETGATAHLLQSEQARKLSESMHPLGRVGQPEEVASLVRWLLSSEAAWVTGQIWSIDGGMGSVLPKMRAN